MTAETSAERQARAQLEANAKAIGKTKRGTPSAGTLERRRRRNSSRGSGPGQALS